jgi:hypothetical protein
MLSVLKLYGQSYTSFIDTNSVWKDRWGVQCSHGSGNFDRKWWDSQEFIKGDTIIGCKYSKLYLTGYKFHNGYYYGSTYDSVRYCNYYIGGLREDTSKKVFYIDTNGTERLLYNFNLQIGDSIDLGAGHDYQLYSFVQSIDSVFIFNKFRKGFNLVQNVCYPYNTALIEGIGTDYGILGSHINPGYDAFCQSFSDLLKAYFYDSTNVYGSEPTAVLTDCEDIGIQEIFPDSIIKIFPNPTNKSLTIENIPKQATIEFFNIQGQIILQQQLQQGTIDFDISRLAKGIYILRMCCNDKTEVIRVVKE